MDLVLDNLQSFDMPLNKETKPWSQMLYIWISRTLCHIFLAQPFSSAVAERTFRWFKLLKSYRNFRMSEDGTSALALLSIKRHLTNGKSTTLNSILVLTTE